MFQYTVLYYTMAAILVRHLVLLGESRASRNLSPQRLSVGVAAWLSAKVEGILYIYIYICIYIYIHACIYIYIYIYICAYIYIYIHMHIYIHRCMHMYIYIGMYLHLFVDL